VADPLVRLDKWLWAARFFKTRALCLAAINAGRVEVDGDRAKPSRHVKVGDRLVVRRPPWEHEVLVKGLDDKRGPASAAARLYAETPESVARREKLRLELKAAPPPVFKGRPTKKTRRDYEKWLAQPDPD
jgi:ribosome-associated heat shock protein Hsp15